MKKREMIAFLKSEGWKQRKDSEFGDMIWIDPAGRWERLNLETAFLIASRRKSARDTRRLKAAGFEYGVGGWSRRQFDAWGVPCIHYPGSKSEALKLLEAGDE